jgi:putative peptidoglycan lipid II flippase
MFSRQNIFQASVILALAIFISRVMGFLREVVIAHSYGASGAYDIYLVAITFPVVIYSLLLYSIPNVFIPIYLKEKAEAGEKAAAAFLRNFINIFGVIFLLLSILLFFLASYIIRGYAPSLDNEQILEAVAILRLVSVIVFLGGIFTVLKSALNANKHFLLPALTPLFLNVAIILSVLLLSRHAATLALAIGLVIGHAIQVVLLIWYFAKRDGVHRFSFDVGHKLLKTAFALLPVILVIETISQLNVVVDRFFISILPPGGLSALNYANTIYQIAIGAFGVTVGTVIFPTLSEYAVRRNWQKLIGLFSKGIRSVLVATIPIVLVSIVFSEEIVAVMFQRGAFNEQASVMTAKALQCFSIGLAAFVSYIILAKIYYALHKEWVLFAATGTGLILKIALSRWLVHHYFHQGLALATSFAGIFNVMVLTIWLRRSIGRVDGRRIFTTFIKISISSAVSVGLSRWAMNALGEILLIYRLCAALVLAGAIFIGLCYLFKIEEITGLIGKAPWQKLFQRSS